MNKVSKLAGRKKKIVVKNKKSFLKTITQQAHSIFVMTSTKATTTLPQRKIKITLPWQPLSIEAKCSEIGCHFRHFSITRYLISLKIDHFQNFVAISYCSFFL